MFSPPQLKISSRCRPVLRPDASKIIAVLFAAGGAGMVIHALTLGIGILPEPGPGLWPAVVGTGLMLCAPLLAFTPASPCKTAVRAARKPTFSAALACGLWIVLLPLLGWIPATLAALAVACRGAGNSRTETLGLMILMVGGLYFGVEKLLRWPLPGGAFAYGLAELGTWIFGGATP